MYRLRLLADKDLELAVIDLCLLPGSVSNRTVASADHFCCARWG
jgi:hypothetical protein